MTCELYVNLKKKQKQYNDFSAKGYLWNADRRDINLMVNGNFEDLIFFRNKIM